MHTCFYVKSSDGYFKKEGVMFEKGGFLSFNSVKSDFAAALKEEGKLFDEIAPKYAERNGGYTRIVRIGPRRGDAAEMAIIELV